MARLHRFSVFGVALLLTLVATRPLTAQMTAAQTKAAKTAATENPELISSLSKAMGSTSDQAAGAAGAFFGLAKSKLSADDFSGLAKAIPGMSSFLGAAPTMDGSSGGGLTDAVSKMTGGGGGLSPVMAAFSKLGLKPEMVAMAAPAITEYVNKKAGPKLGGLLSSLLK